MPGPKPPIVRWTAAEGQGPEELIRVYKTAQKLVLRARMILLLADERNAPETARALGTTRKTVRLWRRHWYVRAAHASQRHPKVGGRSLRPGSTPRTPGNRLAFHPTERA